ncbi:Zinc finger C2H2 superfamily [Sesbania bispinosa]|nr:Zinc finger C2H2 superfamily [Sesbania bispinosa]
MSNLTSASSEISASSGTRNENGSLYPQYSSTSTNQEPQPKKKRSLPGHPDPEAEVIALSPQTLLATNRRGHNLPWKLKKRTSKEIRKKVYVCPEATCVHHDPSRALGDLTGIKKHFFRKHGEKKWKCEKCSKRYAVQSDWKAHSKICGTREYKCDCGTIFSRRDSFITHRAFCDALAQESASQIGVTVSNKTAPSPSMVRPHLQQQGHHVPECTTTTRGGGGGYSSSSYMASSSTVSGMVMPSPYFEDGSSAANTEEASSLFHDMMASTVPSASGFETSPFDMRGSMFNPHRDNNNFQELVVSKSTQSQFSKSSNNIKGSGGVGANNDDEMTRDFLSLGAFSQRDLFNMSGIDPLGFHHMASKA